MEQDSLLAPVSPPCSKGSASQSLAVDASLVVDGGIQRRTLSIRAGQACVVKVPWPTTNSSSSVPATLRWEVVVLGDELTVDLEVTAITTTGDQESACTTVVLQKHARGETFVGTFAPHRDRWTVCKTDEQSQASTPAALLQKHLDIKELVFDFSNT